MDLNHFRDGIISEEQVAFFLWHMAIGEYIHSPPPQKKSFCRNAMC